MAGELEAIVQGMFDGLARNDVEPFVRSSSKEVQLVDEVSRRWTRGFDDVAEYLRQTIQIVEDTHSELSDVREMTWDDNGLVTFWLEQDYTLEGKRQHISAPSSVLFRREGGEWKTLLIHSIPLPPEAATA